MVCWFELLLAIGKTHPTVGFPRYRIHDYVYGVYAQLPSGSRKAFLGFRKIQENILGRLSK